MSFESDFLSMMSSVVTVFTLGSRDMYGAPVVGGAYQSPAHVTYRTGALRTSTEDRSVYSAVLQMPPPAYIALAGAIAYQIQRINEGDQIELPDDDVIRHVLRAICYTDETGDHHQSIWLT